MNSRVIIKATKPDIFSRRIAFKIGQETRTDEGVRLAIAKPLELQQVQEFMSAEHLPPTLSLEPDEAQQFMDELWHIGIRPSEGSGSAGQMTATLRHMEDMRSLVFKTPAKP